MNNALRRRRICNLIPETPAICNFRFSENRMRMCELEIAGS